MLRAYFGWDLRLHPHWKHVFALNWIYFGANGRTDIKYQYWSGALASMKPRTHFFLRPHPHGSSVQMSPKTTGSCSDCSSLFTSKKAWALRSRTFAPLDGPA